MSTPVSTRPVPNTGQESDAHSTAHAREKHRQTLDAIPSLVFVKDVQSRILWGNRAFREFFGKSIEELNGVLDLGTGADEYVEKYMEDDAVVFRTGKPIEILVEPVVRPDGVVREFHTIKAPIFGPHGDVEMLVAIATDITERRRTERALRETQEMLEGLLANTSAIISVKDAQGRYLLVNPAFEKGCGRKAEDILGRRLEDVFSKDVADRLREHDEAVIRDKCTLVSEDMVQQADGAHAYLSTKFPLLNHDGAVRALCMMATDITARRKAEEELQALLQALPDQIFLFNDKFELVASQTPQDGLFLATSDSEPGLHSRRFPPAPMEGALRGAMTRARDSREVQVFEFQLPAEQNDGPRVAEVRVSATTSEEFVAVVRDITDRKTTEERLREISRLKSEFLANMSHEIRTPMNGLLGLTQLLLNTPLADVQREYLLAARKSCNALMAIINDILDFSKIESGKLAVESAPFDLLSLCEDIVEEFRTFAGEGGVELTLDFRDDVPVKVVGDAGRIRQVLVNLVSNAIKFTAAGHVNVQVEALLTSRSSQGSTMIHVSVKDTGIGIAAEQMHRLFQPFVQADGSTTRKFGGTGLGLSICRQLVELMGGTIGAQSKVGEGSTFEFWLSLPVVSSATVEARAAALPKLHILLVDRDDDRRTFLEQRLSSWGVEITSSGGGEHLEALFRHHEERRRPWDGVLVSARHPDEVPWGADDRAMRERGYEIPVVTLASLSRSWGRFRSGSTWAECFANGTHPSRLLDALSRIAQRQTHGGFGPTKDGREGSLGAAIAEDRPPTPRVQRGGLNGTRILLVEDDYVSRVIAGKVLENLGCSVDQAINGREVIEKVKAVSYDLVLMDCQMPELDGYETTRILRSSKLTACPIIAVTASAMAGDREKCLEAGMNDYISKPVSIDALAAVVIEWLDKSRRTILK